jgi:hypothetical protein
MLAVIPPVAIISIYSWNQWTTYGIESARDINGMLEIAYI